MRIKRLTKKDKERFEAFRRAFREETDYFNPMVMHSDGFDKVIDDKNKRFFACLQGKEIIGLIRFDDWKKEVVWIGYGFLKKAQGGAGRMAIEFCKEYAQKNKKRALKSTQTKDNWKAIITVIKHGFKVVSEDDKVVYTEYEFNRISG
jgi:RimJ/RimL family protein N-acetyltransferase